MRSETLIMTHNLPGIRNEFVTQMRQVDVNKMATSKVDL